LFIKQEASRDNAVATQYLEKLRREEVSVDWAHRVLINRIREQRIIKMMTIAHSRHFNPHNQNELEFIASEMKKKGLDPNDEGDLDSYLNAKIL
jgi:hypothetical protein